MAKTHLATLEMQNQIDGKIDGLDGKVDVLVQKVQPTEGGVFYIVLGVSSDYNGTKFTAKHKTDMDEFSATAQAGTCRIEVTKPGTYDITNNKDDQKQTVKIENEYKLTVTSFKATATVTVPEALIGETIQAKQDDTTIEQEAESTEVTFNLTKEGVWNIGLKDNTYVTTTVTISGDGDSQTCELSIDSGVPVIELTVPEKLKGKTIICKQDGQEGTTYEKQVEDTTLTFIVNKTGLWTLQAQDNEYIKTTANVDTAKKVTAEITLDSGVPIIEVTVDEILVGQTVECTLESDTVEAKADTTKVEFILSKLGNYTVKIKDSEFITKSVNVEQAKKYQTSLTVATGVPMITVTTNAEVEGKTLKCTKSVTVLQQKVTNRKAIFLVPETGEWQISCDDFPELTKTVNVEENKNYNCRYAESHIYGVKVKQEESDPGTRVEYVEEAIGKQPVTVEPESGDVTYNDWDQTWIFDKIYPVMLKKDGTVDYKLNPNDYSKKLEGGDSDVAKLTYEGNAMVCIEKMYLKFYEEGGYEYYLVSDEPEDGFKPVGFTRADGTEMDQAYIAMFKGCYDESNALRSISGQQIRNQTSYTDFRTAAKKNGENYNLEPHGLITLLDAIYLILFKNEDSQTVCGRGRDYGTDDSGHHAMSIKTGILNTSGPIGYDPSSQGVKFMHIEDYWGNSLYFWMDGWLYKDSKVYVKFNQPYSDTATDGYTEVTETVTGSGYISKSIAKTEYGRIPCEFSGSTSTYECDNANIPTGSTLYACVRARSGVWNRSYDTVSHTSTDLGAGLSFEPPSAQ